MAIDPDSIHDTRKRILGWEQDSPAEFPRLNLSNLSNKGLNTVFQRLCQTWGKKFQSINSTATPNPPPKTTLPTSLFVLSAHSQFIHPSFINSFTHSFLHSFCHSYIFLFIHPFILSFTLDFHNMISLTLITGILWKNCHDRCVCLCYKEGGNCERVKYKCFLSSKAWQCQCVGDEGPQKGNKGAGKQGESQESQESHLMIFFSSNGSLTSKFFKCAF